MERKYDYELILCIINSGFSEIVMDAAKEVGARGGTVIHARGTANKEAEEYFHITIQPDKEIVMILVAKDIKDAVLHAIYQSAGLKSEGQGIAFTLPVSHVAGLSAARIVPQPTNHESSNNEQGEISADGQEISAQEQSEEQ